ncbi:MAG TPA: glycosyltransferase 87 family protein [Actinomycetota bacterium]|nr:glycosyltransferase 87 family protein [Actinomycetota bacterium]
MAATLLTLGLGLALKAPCAAAGWEDGRQYRWLCYSDIVPLLSTEQLAGGRLPYLEPCREAQWPCDEYPVLTMYTMRLAARGEPGFATFFARNALLLAVAALATAALLERVAGRRALLFALSPTLLVYGFMNWDLLAVALATAGTVAFLRRRDRAAGVLLGLGAGAKLYPALLALPFALHRLREGDGRGLWRVVGWTAGAFVVLNAPFALAAPAAWATVFRYNASRPPDYDSLWFVACRACPWSVRTVNALSLAAFAALALLAWWCRWRREPTFPAWTFGFPLLVAFLLATKVYSPQYGLWLLPWFVVAFPNPWLFAAFQAADAAVFVTRFQWFGRLLAQAGDPALAGFAGVPLWAFQAALLARAAILLACLWAWARSPGTPLPRVGDPSVVRAEAAA